MRVLLVSLLLLIATTDGIGIRPARRDAATATSPLTPTPRPTASNVPSSSPIPDPSMTFDIVTDAALADGATPAPTPKSFLFSTTGIIVAVCAFVALVTLLVVGRAVARKVSHTRHLHRSPAAGSAQHSGATATPRPLFRMDTGQTLWIPAKPTGGGGGGGASRKRGSLVVDGGELPGIAKAAASTKSRFTVAFYLGSRVRGREEDSATQGLGLDTARLEREEDGDGVAGRRTGSNATGFGASPTSDDDVIVDAADAWSDVDIEAAPTPSAQRGRTEAVAVAAAGTHSCVDAPSAPVVTRTADAMVVIDTTASAAVVAATAAAVATAAVAADATATVPPPTLAPSTAAASGSAVDLTAPPVPVPPMVSLSQLTGADVVMFTTDATAGSLATVVKPHASKVRRHRRSSGDASRHASPTRSSAGNEPLRVHVTLPTLAAPLAKPVDVSTPSSAFRQLQTTAELVQ